MVTENQNKTFINSLNEQDIKGLFQELEVTREYLENKLKYFSFSDRTNSDGTLLMEIDVHCSRYPHAVDVSIWEKGLSGPDDIVFVHTVRGYKVYSRESGFLLKVIAYVATVKKDPVSPDIYVGAHERVAIESDIEGFVCYR